MNFLGGLKSKIKGIYKASPNENEEALPSFKMDFEDIQHTLSVLQEENKILKSKVRILENSIFEDKSSSNNSSITSSSQFGKIFKEIKSTILYNTDEEPRDNLQDFKRFLYDNILLHGNIDEDDVEMLNNIQVSDAEWDKKKEIYLFKQRVLEKNYADIFRNLIVSNQLNTYIKSKGILPITNQLKKDKEETQNECVIVNSPQEDEDKFTSLTSIKYQDNTMNKIETFTKKEKLNENTLIVSNIDQANSIKNKQIQTENKPLAIEKPNFQIEHKLLSDLILSENNQDNLVRTISRKERSSVGSNLNASDNTAQDNKNKTPPMISQRNTVNSSLKVDMNDDLRISTLLSDNNLTTSINLVENATRNQIVEYPSSKNKQEYQQVESKDNLNINNLFSNATKISKVTSNLNENILNNQKISKTDLKKSVLEFAEEDEDDFTFGAIINTEKNTNTTSKLKTSMIKQTVSQKRENFDNQNVNIFEKLLQTDKNSANSSSKNINVKKSQWDDEQEDDPNSYV